MRFPFFSSNKDRYILEYSELPIRLTRVRVSDGGFEVLEALSFDGKEAMSAFLEKRPLPKAAQILCVYHRPLAATFTASVRLERGGAASSIKESDVESFLAHATSQFFNRFREEARRALRAEDVNVVLANNRFFNIRLDGKNVVNPLGLKARSAELEMEQTFLFREVLDFLHDILPEQARLFHIDESAVAKDMLLRAYAEDRIILSMVGRRRTDFFSFGGKNRYFGAVSFPMLMERGSFEWGYGAIEDAMQKRFGVSRVAAANLLALYAGGGVSQHFARGIEKAIAEERSVFVREAKKALKKETRVVVISATPFFAAHSNEDGVMFKSPLMHDVAALYGMSFSINTDIVREALSPLLPATLIAYGARTGDNYLHLHAKKRMEWLKPINSA